MSTWALLLLAALLPFWVLGAHKRLTTLRQGVHAVWAQIVEQWQCRRTLAAALTAALRDPLPDELASFDALLAALDQALAATASLSPLQVHHAAADVFAPAQARCDAALARLHSLIDLHAELREQDDLARTVAELLSVDQRIAFARQAFNDGAQRYNDALHEFPTRWVARWFDFTQARPI